ncbi:MAG: hypothetical protein RBT57_12595 [Paludibacter sp.]|jgi:hypothetical protein|nr:hypothetical protein [Paludibacter sp.]
MAFYQLITTQKLPVSINEIWDFIGAIANSIVIRKKLREIFAYRTIALEKRFGKYKA